MGDNLSNVMNWHSDFSIYFAHKTHETLDKSCRDPKVNFNSTYKGSQAIGYHTVLNLIISVH